MVPRLCDSFRSLCSGENVPREPSQYPQINTQRALQQTQCRQRAFPELRIIADFQAGCPTAGNRGCLADVWPLGEVANALSTFWKAFQLRENSVSHSFCISRIQLGSATERCLKNTSFGVR